MADSGIITVAVPAMGESISEGTVASILKGVGDSVAEDDVIAQLDTDKVTMDIKYQEKMPGVIKSILVEEGATVEVGQAFAEIEPTEGEGNAEKPKKAKEEQQQQPKEQEKETTSKGKEGKGEQGPAQEPPKAQQQPAPQQSSKPPSPPPQQQPDASSSKPSERPERRIKMTRLRLRIAERLKAAQNTYAMLTTFNEVDMTNLMEMRNEYKEAFLERHGVKLGFMSAFVKASVNALQFVPTVNGVIENDSIVYRDYYDISVAVATPKGLVVPVLRDADLLTFAGVEKTINELGKKAKDGTLSIDEMAGGTFTISNGGVFGSLMGTPIINPPQSAILGMHATKLRPAVVGNQVLARPMMYLALTYDHRLVDGREAVTFLKRIKEVIEDPRRLLLDI